MYDSSQIVEVFFFRINNHTLSQCLGVSSSSCVVNPNIDLQHPTILTTFPLHHIIESAFNVVYDLPNVLQPVSSSKFLILNSFRYHFRWQSAVSQNVFLSSSILLSTILFHKHFTLPVIFSTSSFLILSDHFNTFW